VTDSGRRARDRGRDLSVWLRALAWLLVGPLLVALWAQSRPRSERGLAWGLVALVTGAWLAVGACVGAGLAAQRPPTPADAAATTEQPMGRSPVHLGSTTAPQAAPSETSAPTTTSPSGSAPPGTAGAHGLVGTAPIDQLVVAPEGSGDGYDRALFAHWIDADGDGCDTRAEVLIAESRVPAQVSRDGCTVIAGDWVSAYDGQATTDPSELDIDHVVALAEAWRSGADAWTPSRREAYANDVTDGEALAAVTAASNRSKSDSDPASWQPPAASDRCAYATAWVDVKVRWRLTVDAAEFSALRDMLHGC
jgi:hypothetical protein